MTKALMLKGLKHDCWNVGLFKDHLFRWIVLGTVW